MSRSEYNVSRRDLLKFTSAGLLGTSMSGWFGGLAAHAAAQEKRPKSCILLWMNGGPSQHHTFHLPEQGSEFKAIDTTVPGIKVSEYLPGLAKHMKDMALVRSMSTTEGVHERARFLMHNGYPMSGSAVYPALGSIVSHQLSDPNFELPTFVAVDGGVDGNNAGGAFRSVSAHLGAKHAPLLVPDPTKGVANLKPAIGLTEFDERAALLDKAEKEFQDRYGSGAGETHRTIYQRAVRLLHSNRAKAFEVDQEPEKTREAYGSSQFGKGCLLARRLVEVGVPFVEVTLGGWDDHGGAAKPIAKRSPYMDQGMSALLSDLKDRGLLSSTLVIWMGEFGRSPGNGNGHYPRAWTLMMAGGGVKGGQVIGATDEYGYKADYEPYSVHDMHATILHAMGLDHRKLTYYYGGRDQRLTNFGGDPVLKVFA